MPKQSRIDLPKSELPDFLQDLALQPQFKVVSQEALGDLVIVIVENTDLPDDPPPPAGDNDPPPPPPPSGSIRAKPGNNQVVVDALIAGAIKHDLDPMMILTFIAIESHYDPVICNKNTSAAGLFQFIDSTWAAVGGPTFPGRGGKNNGQAAGASVNLQVELGCKFTKSNANALRAQLGSEPSTTQIYMAHQQGLGGALKILKGDKGAPITSVISADAAKLNGFAGLTVGQTIAKFQDLVNKMAVVANAQVVAGAAPPAAPAPGGGGATPSGASQNGGGGAAASGGGATAAASIKQKAVSIALAERTKFALNNGNVVTETHEPLASRVLQYFAFVDRPDIKKPDAEPWSAAFISFVIKSAGATDAQFVKSQNHAKYILAGLANRIKDQVEAPIVYFDRNEVVPQAGDLVGFSRDGAVKSRADIEKFLPDKFFASHTDLVIENSGGTIKAIGGNVSQTIKVTTIRADAAGKIDPSAQHFFVLRMNV
jgi:hypothetical protein